MQTPIARSLFPGLGPAVVAVFGADADGIEAVAARAAVHLRGWDVIVWEGDPSTFEFTYVSPESARILGHPAPDWLRAGFWAEVVLHEEDCRDAIAYCALATAQGRDHEFEYRARRSDGSLRWLYDIVKVIKGPKRIPKQLRGIMLDITHLKQAAGEAERRAERRFPELAEGPAAAPASEEVEGSRTSA